MIKIDLHTHSTASKDGGSSPASYHQMLASGRLDVIAVTDHGRIDVAEQLHSELGDKIIIGEEVSTADGDIIGLYLHEVVPAGRTALEAAELIHKQGGLVYVPHPFDLFRRSAGRRMLERMISQADIIEISNGRMAVQSSNTAARQWAVQHNVPGAASSDAHGWHGWGRTYTVIEHVPDAESLPDLLRHATYHTGRPGIRAMLYPKYNRLKKRLARG